MAKFYAVKKGYNVGIYNTWAECQREVNGYSGAIYKSFGSYEEAENFLSDNAINSSQNTEEKNYAYVDGSYDAENKIYGSGIVIVTEKYGIHKKMLANNDKDLAELRNVAGEIEAVKYVMNYAKEKMLNDITIYYDYMGIEAWATGNWQANLTYTKEYASFAKNIMRDVKVYFKKVKAHSGVALNEEVDGLAKESIIKFKQGKLLDEEKETTINIDDFLFGTEEDNENIENLKRDRIEQQSFFDEL